MNISILGSGGHAKCVLELIYNNGVIECESVVIMKVNMTFIYDDNIKKHNKIIYGALVIDSILNMNFKSPFLFCAIGDNIIRKKIVENINMMKSNIHWIILKGINNSIASTVNISKGTLILNNINIGPDVKIGKHCIINNHANIDHESVIGDYVHIAPNATLCGNVNIGECTLIGAGAIILPNIIIGNNLIIKAGSIIKKNIFTVDELIIYYKNFKY